MRAIQVIIFLCAASLPLGLAAQISKAPSGDPTFLGRSSVLLDGQASNAVFLADINHDGNRDLIVQDYIPEGLQVLYGDSKGNFTQGPLFLLSPNGSLFSQLVDMNGDGVLDFLYCAGLNEFYIAYGNSDGTFQTEK